MSSGVAVRGRGVPQEDFLEKRFDLTPAEARLVVHLVQGTSLKFSAEALGVTYETARTCLKSVFQKTGTRRQPQLVLKVFHAISAPNTPAVPAAMSARELRTAVQNGQATSYGRSTESSARRRREWPLAPPW